MLRVLGGLISQSEDLRVESEALSTLFAWKPPVFSVK